MNDDQFRLHASIEDTHWWFVARRRIISLLVKEVLPNNRKSTILDIGCGTGANIGAFSDEHDCWGIDISTAAIELAVKRFPAVNFSVGAVSDEPSRKVIAKADCVLLLDVLEHVADDFQLLSQTLHEMKSGAILIATVPADPALWSPHDVHLDHYRRYDSNSFRQLWAELGVTCQLLSYFNSRFFPLIKFVRRISVLHGSSAGRCGTDLFEFPAWISKHLSRIMEGESTRLVRALHGEASQAYRQGVSLVAVLRRNDEVLSIPGRPLCLSPDPVKEPIENVFGLNAEHE